MSEAVIARRGGQAFNFSGATASASQVLSGKKGFNATGALITGTMTNRGAWSTTVAPGSSVTIPAGYHSGSGKVTCSASKAAVMSVRSVVKDEDFVVPSNIQGNVSVAAVGGGGNGTNALTSVGEFNLAADTVVPITIGLGNAEGTGGTTSFGNYLSATGGGGDVNGEAVGQSGISNDFGGSGRSGAVVLQYYTATEEAV